MKLIEDVFKIEPSQWGLRGNPTKWQELRNSLRDSTENLHQLEFEEALEKRFFAIVQKEEKQASNDIVWFEKFPQTGMSGGSISLKWRQEKGLP